MKPINPDSLYFVKINRYGDYHNLIATCHLIGCENKSIFVCKSTTCDRCIMPVSSNHYERLGKIIKET